MSDVKTVGLYDYRKPFRNEDSVFLSLEGEEVLNSHERSERWVTVPEELAKRIGAALTLLHNVSTDDMVASASGLASFMKENEISQVGDYVAAKRNSNYTQPVEDEDDKRVKAGMKQKIDAFAWNKTLQELYCKVDDGEEEGELQELQEEEDVRNEMPADIYWEIDSITEKPTINEVLVLKNAMKDYRKSTQAYAGMVSNKVNQINSMIRTLSKMADCQAWLDENSNQKSGSELGERELRTVEEINDELVSLNRKVKMADPNGTASDIYYAQIGLLHWVLNLPDIDVTF